MDLTPNDIRNYEFPSALRGYDKDKVDEFAEQVASVLEEAKQEVLKLTMELNSVRSQLTGLKQFEDTIKNAAIDSRRNADTLLSNAKVEAERILNDARNIVQKTVDEHRSRITDVEEKVHQLELVKKSYFNKLRTLISSHMDLVDEVADLEAPKLDTTGINLGGVDGDVVQSEEAGVIQPSTPEAVSQETGEMAQEYEAPAPRVHEVAEGEEPPTEKLDPELAAALANYHADDAAPKEMPAPPAPELDEIPQVSPPRPPAIVETNARAEDIPIGFVAKDGEISARQTNQNGHNQPSDKLPLESNSVDIDSDIDKPTEDILSTLDEVVQKVNELDKAEKK